MNELLSVETVFFTVLDYPMSYLEFFGTVCYLWSVWLIARRNLLTWPVGMVSVLLYMALFYQIRLYADALEQVYYLGASVYGWWYWSRSRCEQHTLLEVGYSPPRWVLIWLAVTALGSIALGGVVSQLHEWAPTAFPEPASYPWLDALTTVMSLVAMWLMARRRIESWLYWIVVDIAGIGLYFVKTVWFVALLYVLLLGLAIRGFLDWRRQALKNAGST